MAYDTLKTEIRQYIKTNGANEITGQILQNVLLDMVNAYPSLDGYATQQWVQNQLSDMATMTWVGQNFVQNSALNNYLPLSGGVMTGFITAGTLSTGGYSLGNTGLSFEYSSNGSPRYAHAINISSVDGTITFYGRGMTEGTVIKAGQITSDKFIVTNGTSSQFLKADGSVDNNTYVTRSPSYLDFEQGSSADDEGRIYNDTVISYQSIYTQDMILPAGRYTYSFYLTGNDLWTEGTTITVRNRDTNAVIPPYSISSDSQDTYQGANRCWVSFYLPQMTAVRIELDDPAGATLTMYKPCLNMGYNRMKIA